MYNIKEKIAKGFSDGAFNLVAFIMRVSVSLVILMLWVLISAGIFKFVLKIPVGLQFDFEMVLYLVILAYLFAGNLRLSSKVNKLEEKVLKKEQG